MATSAQPTDQFAEIPDDVGVFTIHMVARMSGIAPRLLRSWDSLLSPSHSQGGHRLYSKNDVRRAADIKKYRERGLPLAGIKSLLSKEQKKGQGGTP